MVIEPAALIDSRQIAEIHCTGITSGFLSSLGSDFLNALYKYLIRREIVLVCKDGHDITGFVCCSLNSDGLMKKFFLYPEGVMYFILAVLKRPSLLKPAYEIIKIPRISKTSVKVEQETILPRTELLSISISPGVQNKGAGTMLLAELAKTLLEKGVKSYKVVAGANLVGANKFYMKNGFHPVSEITIHGKDRSIVYCKSLL